jgi:aspartyl-tRNA(Asn)/glutamyl-tRNA(Gln) amidotransferase subunit A
MMGDHWRLDARSLSQGYAAGALSPLEVVGSVLARAREVQPRLNPLTHLDEAGALAAARQSEDRWRTGMQRSLLDGVPMTVKDNIPVRGMPCRWGSRLYEAHLPGDDETPVARLRAAGAVLLGKTNVPEFTLLGYTDNLLQGPTRNPWNPELTPGGSSGGAVVAVASGIGPIALATDGGGSIRRPCSHTGLVGLKPGAGRVPRAHGLPELLPDLEVIGPVARTVEDLLLVLEVIGPRLAPLPELPTSRLRIACWRHIADGPVDRDVLASFDEAMDHLRQEGHVVEALPAPAIVDRFNREAWPVLAGTGLARVLQPWARQLGEASVGDRLTPAMAALWAMARELPASAVPQAQALVAQLRASIAALLERHDLLATPSAAALPWPAHQTHPTLIDQRPAGPRSHAVFTAFANACGLPALALPTAPTAAGLPTGMQWVGRPGTEEWLCALGQRWEALQPWRHRWPELPPHPATPTP